MQRETEELVGGLLKANGACVQAAVPTKLLYFANGHARQEDAPVEELLLPVTKGVQINE